MEQFLSGITFDSIDFIKERQTFEVPRDCGGYVCFEGVVRDHHEARQVQHLEYEIYETLAASEMKLIIAEAKEKFGLCKIQLVHRGGKLKIGDTAILIQVAGRHRNECFQGNRYIIDQIKTRLPIWKHEHYTDGTSKWTKCSDHEHDFN